MENTDETILFICARSHLHFAASAASQALSSKLHTVGKLPHRVTADSEISSGGKLKSSLSMILTPLNLRRRKYMIAVHDSIGCGLLARAVTAV